MIDWQNGTIIGIMLQRQQLLTRVGILDAKLGGMIMIIISLIRGTVNCLYCDDGTFRDNSVSGYWYDNNNCDNGCHGCGGCSCGGSCPPCGCSDSAVYYFTCGKLIYIKIFYRGYHW